MKDICVWAIVASTVSFGSYYIFQILKKKTVPTVSTWIIFLFGCVPSFFTYFVAENHDIKSGILNTMDVVYVIIVLLAISFSCKREKRDEQEEKRQKDKVKSFEKWYLSGAGAVITYGLITGNVWNSNVLTQILMSIAYFPMFHKLVAEKKNTESFFTWIPATLNSLVSFFPAICEGNSLAIIYTSRAFVFSFSTCILMAYYQFSRPRIKP